MIACADVFRIVVKAGAPKLKAKTVEAVVEHITQTLLKADGDFCEPLTQDYLKALSAVFEPKANVERLKPATWSEVVDFCIRGINRFSDDGNGNGDTLALSLRSPGVQSSYVSGSLARTLNSSGRVQAKSDGVSRQSVEELLVTLLSLVSAPNVPLLQGSEDITTSIIHFLRSQGSAVSMLHQLAFSILNAVLSFVREDRISLLHSATEDILPAISRFWQGKNLAKDEMLNSVRDEMLIFLFTVNLHLERRILDADAVNLASNVEDLLDVMRAEYARRLDRDPLLLEDLDMLDFGAADGKATPFHLHVFRLRQHNSRAERNWAQLQIIGILERLVGLAEQQRNLGAIPVDNEEDRHPRKRQRTSRQSDRLLRPIKAKDNQVRLGALQALPFILQNYELNSVDLTEMITQLATCASEKDNRIVSWALLGIARYATFVDCSRITDSGFSCAKQKSATREGHTDWIQLWHIGGRALTFPATCRAAAVQLHSMLAANLVQYQEVGEDVNAMITSADVSGPVALCDSSLILMMHLLHVRVTEVPGASLIVCQHVIRWLFARWNPGTYIVSLSCIDC